MRPPLSRALALSAGLVLLLGCSGLLGEATDDEDGVAGAETGDTGEVHDDDEEEEPVDSAPPLDSGTEQRPPRRRKKRDDKDREKRGGGEQQPRPSPKPAPGKGGGTRSMCFGGSGLDLQLDIQGDKVRGSLTLSGKANVDVPKLTGTRDGNRIKASGEGTINGKNKTVQVQAGKAGSGPVVKIDGRDVPGAKIVSCP